MFSVSILTALPEGAPTAPLVAVKVVVAVVLLSVIVNVPVAEPTVNVTVSAVLELTVGAPRLAPLPPLSPNKVLAVSDDHSVLVPVQVRLGVVLTAPLVGVQETPAVATVIVVLIESVVSLIVSVPVPDPVLITIVCDVAELFVELTRDAPVTPEMLKLVLPVQEVPLPVQVSVILPLWFAGTVAGEQEKLALELSVSYTRSSNWRTSGKRMFPPAHDPGFEASAY
jgi:hypothetical protein